MQLCTLVKLCRCVSCGRYRRGHKFENAFFFKNLMWDFWSFSHLFYKFIAFYRLTSANCHNIWRNVGAVAINCYIWISVIKFTKNQDVRFHAFLNSFWIFSVFSCCRQARRHAFKSAIVTGDRALWQFMSISVSAKMSL